jgi:hypothetical protein
VYCNRTGRRGPSKERSSRRAPGAPSGLCVPLGSPSGVACGVAAGPGGRHAGRRARSSARRSTDDRRPRAADGAASMCGPRGADACLRPRPCEPPPRGVAGATGRPSPRRSRSASPRGGALPTVPRPADGLDVDRAVSLCPASGGPPHSGGSRLGVCALGEGGVCTGSRLGRSAHRGAAPHARPVPSAACCWRTGAPLPHAVAPRPARRVPAAAWGHRDRRNRASHRLHPPRVWAYRLGANVERPALATLPVGAAQRGTHARHCCVRLGHAGWGLGAVSARPRPRPVEGGPPHRCVAVWR